MFYCTYFATEIVFHHMYYLQFLLVWFPFYYLIKLVFVGLLLVPRTRLVPFVFETSVVPAITRVHIFLDSLSASNPIDFILSLPIKVLILVFPGIDAYIPSIENLNEEFSPRSLSRITASKMREDAKYNHESTAKNQDNSDSDSVATEVAAIGDIKIEQINDDLDDDKSEIVDDKILNCDPLKDRKRHFRTSSAKDVLRNAMTGNAGIRMRDHLFDLKTSVPPAPKKILDLQKKTARINGLAENTKNQAVDLTE